MAIEFHRDGPWELPGGWVWARLGDLGHWSSGGTPKADVTEYYVGDIPWFRITELNEGRLTEAAKTLTRLGLENSSAKVITAPFLMFAMYGASIGKMAISDIDAATNQAIACCKPFPGIQIEYLFWALKYAKQQLISKGQGGAQPNISQAILLEHLVPVAPTAEQRRIVARIDELFTEIADGDTALARARDDLDTWRRALLKAAVTGELTREWRERNKSNETGRDVLSRVAKARVGYKTTKARGRKLVVEEIEEEPLPEIPSTWAWASLGELGDIVGGITVDKKRRPTDPVTVPYLRVANVQRGRLDLTQIKTIVANRDDAAALFLQVGDIFLNEGGDRDKIGRGWVWNGEIEKCIHQNHIFRVRLFDSGINPYFISHFANEMGRRFFVEKGKQTTNLASISMSKISQLRIPIPPTAEMDEAMRLLDEMLVATVDVEAELRAASLSGPARQSILKAAFEGRLVEQDLCDESVDRLLTRLTEQGGTTVQLRQTRRPKRATLAAE